MRINTFIFGRPSYQVIGAAVVAQRLSGGETYVYKNGLLPADTDPAHIDHLLNRGLIRKLEGTAE